MTHTATPRGFARERVLGAAQALFAEHGVGSTSLQMIADRLGVKKSAVYYQFHSKDDIVVEVFRPAFEDITRVIKIAEAIAAPEVRREAALSGMIELAVRHRRTTALVHTDPAVAQMIQAVGEYRDAFHRLRAILAGPEPDPFARTTAAVLVSGIFGAAADPAAADIPNEELHRLLLECSRRLTGD